MKNKNKRIHGKLLIVTGVVHILVSLLPGVFGEQLLEFANNGFFNISKGIAAFPLCGGTLHYDKFAAFWFFYMGPLLLMYGHLIDTVEQINGNIPRQAAVNLLIVSFIGTYMIPFSGMTILLIPQAIYMLIRSKTN